MQISIADVALRSAVFLQVHSSGKGDSRKITILGGDGNVKNSEDWAGLRFKLRRFLCGFCAVFFFSFLFVNISEDICVSVTVRPASWLPRSRLSRPVQARRSQSRSQRPLLKAMAIMAGLFLMSRLIMFLRALLSRCVYAYPGRDLEEANHAPPQIDLPRLLNSRSRRIDGPNHSRGQFVHYR